jgi:hypothetical protein
MSDTAVRSGTSAPQYHVPDTTTSRSRPLASPAPRVRARGLAKAAPTIGPPRGRITINRGLRCLTVPSGLAPFTSPPTPLVRVVGDQCLRGRHGRPFLLRPCGRSRDARRLARRPRHPLRMSPCRRRCPQLERLDRRESGDGRRPPLSKRRGRVSDCPSKSKAHGEQCYSPQIGESPLPLPRGLEGNLRCTRRRLRDARWHLL